jgi:hypothetical protein
MDPARPLAATKEEDLAQRAQRTQRREEGIEESLDVSCVSVSLV